MVMFVENWKYKLDSYMKLTVAFDLMVIYRLLYMYSLVWFRSSQIVYRVRKKLFSLFIEKYQHVGSIYL
jgi:hypothetical protein